MSNSTAGSPWKRFWNAGTWWKAALAVVVYLALYRLAGSGIGRVFGDQIDQENIFATPSSVFFGIGSAILVGAVILLVFLASLRWLRPVFAHQTVTSRWWMWIFVVLALVPIVLRLVGIDYAAYGVPVVAMSLFVGLIIGFTEELLYRGVVIKILRDGGHRERTVAVLSSLFFALSHSLNLLSGMPVLTVALTVVYTFGFGMIMYVVMRATGSIIWAMLLHALTDPTTFLASGGVDSAGAVTAHSPALDLAAPFNIVFVVAGLIAVIFIRGKVADPGEPARA